MRAVFEFPPRLSCNILVNLESRYGICPESLLALFFSASRLITVPKVKRDLLIEFASRSWEPVDPVLFDFSLPARSTKFSDETR